MTEKQVLEKKQTLHNQLVAIVADYKSADNVGLCECLSEVLTTHEIVLITAKQRSSHIAIHNANSNDLE